MSEDSSIKPIYRSVVAVFLAVTVAVVVVLGLKQSKRSSDEGNPGSTPSLKQASQRLAGSPRKLAALHAQAAKLIPPSAVTATEQIKQLKGFPIVVNKWASWCGPCRVEFPLFQRQSVVYGRQVAFIGLNSGDNRAEALSFLKQHPTSFPSFEDPNEGFARKLGAGRGYPATLFYRADGSLSYVHQGQYPTEASLVADIKRYALGSQ